METKEREVSPMSNEQKVYSEYAIHIQTLEGIFKYLASKPYAEVVGIINVLQSLKPILTSEVIKPEIKAEEEKK